MFKISICLIEYKCNFADLSSKPSIYNPKIEIPKKSAGAGTAAPNSFEQAKRIAEEKAKRMMEEARKANLTTSRPPRPGKTQQKSRTSNLEAFKEELKRYERLFDFFTKPKFHGARVD